MKRLIRILQVATLTTMVCIAYDAYCHWHFDVVDPSELYQMDKYRYETENGIEIPYITFKEWQEDQDRRSEGFWDEFGHQCAESFDPWYERPSHEEKSEKGRD